MDLIDAKKFQMKVIRKDKLLTQQICTTSIGKDVILPYHKVMILSYIIRNIIDTIKSIYYNIPSTMITELETKFCLALINVFLYLYNTQYKLPPIHNTFSFHMTL